ncbi:cathelicidin-related peptide Oh-Cath-like [Ambystoma mexicanum]|uniref:cathelicidin-related peptide Oh-Cath-like n=1 Tax=Ambystoma mexicanum TaxID=8296 RepID=UPI0037E8A014
MDAWLGVWLLVSASIGACYSLPLQASQGVEDLATVARLVESYNKGSQEDSLFRLLGVLPTPRQENPAGAQHLKFTVKETTCQKSEEQNIQNCDFKHGGLLKVCSASFLTDQEPSTLVLVCDSVALQHNRVKRSPNTNGGKQGSKCKAKDKAEGKCKPKRLDFNTGGFSSIAVVPDLQPMKSGLPEKRAYVKRSANEKSNGRRKVIKCKAKEKENGKCKPKQPIINPGGLSSIAQVPSFNPGGLSSIASVRDHGIYIDPHESIA